MTATLLRDILVENQDREAGDWEMSDVLKIALNRRDELTKEVTKLDDFIRMADGLLRTQQKQDPTPAVDPVQAHFNSGEIIPPASGDRETGSSAKAARSGVFRRG